MIKRAAVAWLAVALGGSAWASVDAPPVTQADQAGIEASVAAFATAMDARRFDIIIDFIPPRVIDAVAVKMGASAADFKSQFAVRAAEALKVVKLVSFEMDMPAAVAGVTPGRRRAYMLIPSESVMELPTGRRLRSKSTTLALKDDDRWYLIRVEHPSQILLLRQVYPDFADVEFPQGSITPAD